MMNSTFSFQDDSPLSKQKAGNKTVSSLDRFGRTTLIRNLAQAISASVSKNGSLVVSLEGPWGSGKTSAKNMLEESLTECWANKRKHSNNYPRLINAEFDPWLFSGSNDVVSLMFSSIINAIDVYLPEELEKRTSFSRKIEATGKALDIASHIDPSGILKSASDALQWVSENLNPTDNNVKSLIQARNELIRQLRSLPEDYAIVVYIDEIDRLDDKDIAALFKALKSVGNLPHVIYVPVFDREIVAAALDRVTQQGRGNQYLEKIIQIPIVLPKIPIEVVWEDFMKEISFYNKSAIKQKHLAHNVFELKNDIFAKLEHHLMVLKKYDIAPIKCDNNTALRESYLGQESKLIGYIAKNKYILEEDIKENRQMLEDSLMNKVSDMTDFIITEKGKLTGIFNGNEEDSLVDFITRDKSRLIFFISENKSILANYFIDKPEDSDSFLKENKQYLALYTVKNENALASYIAKNANTLADFLTVNPNILDEYIQEHSEQIKAHLSSLNNYIQNKAQIIECFKDEYILKRYITDCINMVVPYLIRNKSLRDSKSPEESFINKNEDELAYFALQETDRLAGFIGKYTRETADYFNRNKDILKKFITEYRNSAEFQCDNILKSYIHEKIDSKSYLYHFITDFEKELHQSVTEFKKEPSKDLLNSCVKPFVHNFRDAHRILNAFRIPALQLRNEINLTELLYLTVIKLYDHVFYDWIYQHRDSLLDNSLTLPEKNMAEKYDEDIDSKLKSLPFNNENPSDNVIARRRDALSILFPKYQMMHLNAIYATDKTTIFVTCDRTSVSISDPNFFEKYFLDEDFDSHPSQSSEDIEK